MPDPQGSGETASLVRNKKTGQTQVFVGKPDEVTEQIRSLIESDRDWEQVGVPETVPKDYGGALRSWAEKDDGSLNRDAVDAAKRYRDKTSPPPQPLPPIRKAPLQREMGDEVMQHPVTPTPRPQYDPTEKYRRPRDFQGGWVRVDSTEDDDLMSAPMRQRVAMGRG